MKFQISVALFRKLANNNQMNNLRIAVRDEAQRADTQQI